MIRYSLLVLLFAAQSLTAQKKYEPTWESIDSRPVPEWWQDAKFGIFIHWGVFSVPAWGATSRDIDNNSDDPAIKVYGKYAEWYWRRLNDKNDKVHTYFKKHHVNTYGENFKYQDFAPKFTAQFFDPESWSDIFAAAGAKYVVLTSKHHEGFTLWPSAQSWNWNSVDIGPHRDLAGDLSQAVKKKGLHMGFYFSLYEWYNPDYLNDFPKYVDEHMVPQLKDLVTRYKPDVLWSDGEWEHTSDEWKSKEFITWLYNDSEVKNSIVINDRWGTDARTKHGGFLTTEYEVEKLKVSRPWEECRGIGGSFGYNAAENLEDYSTTKDLVALLCEKVSGGGNLLLNVGPTADGRIPVIMQERLIEIGAWLKVNGEAIYGTRTWSNADLTKNQTKLFFTKKGNDVYVITTEWTPTISIDGVASANVSLLGYDGKIKSKMNGSKLTITAPAVTPSTIPCQYAWVYKVEGGAR